MSYSATKRSRGLRALQIWCQRVTAAYEPRVQITDMSKSFRNGLAFCAIIHHFRPDLIPEMDSLQPENIFENNQLAFRIAEDELDIPSLLDPQDMLDTAEPDKFSIVTYVSQFYHLFKDADNSCKSSPNITGVTGLPGIPGLPGLRKHVVLTGTNSNNSNESENDSLLQLSSSEENDCSISPSAPKLLFNHDQLVAKYGEEIFSTSSPALPSKKRENSINKSELQKVDVRGLCRKFVSKAVIAEEKES